MAPNAPRKPSAVTSPRSGDQKLPGREPQDADIPHQSVYGKNVRCPKQHAYQQEYLALAKQRTVAALGAQKIQTQNGKTYANPCIPRGLAVKYKEVENRCQDGIQSRNKAGLAGIPDDTRAGLLQGGCDSKQASADQRRAGSLDMARPARGFIQVLLPLGNEVDGDQTYGAQQEPGSVKCHGGQVIRTQYLCYNGKAPDHGSQEQHEGGGKVSFHWLRFSFCKGGYAKGGEPAPPGKGTYSFTR